MKWLKKDPRLTISMTVSMPLNFIFQLMQQSKNKEIETAFPDFPDAISRYLSPFDSLKEKWGKIDSKEFIKEYGDLYQSQFDVYFSSPEQKREFEEWYNQRNGK